MDDCHGDSQPPPPETDDATFTGALNKMVEEAVNDRRLLYQGLLSRMAPRQVPWAKVLCQLDRMFLLAVEKEEVGWVECLQEHLLDCMPHLEVCNRFPHPVPDRNICPREEGILSGKLYLDPGTPWWKSEMVETQQVSVVWLSFPVSIGRVPPVGYGLPRGLICQRGNQIYSPYCIPRPSNAPSGGHIFGG